MGGEHYFRLLCGSKKRGATGGYGGARSDPYSTEINAAGTASSVLVFDSRLWHAIAPNRGAEPRVGVVIRYAPWWLNLEVLMPRSDE